MSIGIHFGISNYDPALLADTVAHLSSFGHPPYVEPSVIDQSQFYTTFGGRECLGRSALDHNSASTFSALGSLATATGKEATALGTIEELDRPCVFLPIEMPVSATTRFGHLIAATQLIGELLEVAPQIALPVEDRSISDAQAAAINEGEGDEEYIELQVAWLTLFEAARICQAKRIAFVLA